ncbi:MAG: hypothetical protein QXK37_05020 [Candidatus Woesearchaeota archaeon]
MKRIWFLPILLSFLIASISVFSSEFSSQDNECIANGFDYEIARFECQKNYSINDNGTGINVEWYGCEKINWTSDYQIDAVLIKEAKNTYLHAGGYSGTVTTTTESEIDYMILCGKNRQIPEFSNLAAGIALLGALSIYLIARKKDE